MLRNTHHHDDPKSAIARSLRSANVNTNSYNHEICLASKGSSSGKPPTGSFLRPLLISTNESVSNHCRISIVFRLVHWPESVQLLLWLACRPGMKNPCILFLLRLPLWSINLSVSNHCRISIVFRPSGSLAGIFPAPPLARMSSRHGEPMYSIPPPAPIMVDQPVREY